MKLLAVDDESVIVEIIKGVIITSGLVKENEFFTASNGKEALGLYDKHEFDVLITDIRMPEMDGIALIEKIRARERGTEIIVLTSLDETDLTESVLRFGLVELLRKPFHSRELILAVKKVEEKLLLKKKNDEFMSRLITAEKLSSLGLLAAGVAHEINNPNTYIKGNLQLLLKYAEVIKPIMERAIKESDENRTRYQFVHDRFTDTVSSAIDGCDRITKIVSGLLSYSRVSGNRREEVNVSRIIENAVALTKHNQKEHDLRVDIGVELPSIKVNAQEVLQVFINMITNAMDALSERFPGGKGGLEIKVGHEVETDQILISFRDNGSGMTDEVKARIFKPFFTTKAPGKGTGLGLSICKGYIESNGGTIFCESVKGEGTNFKIRFPVI